MLDRRDLIPVFRSDFMRAFCTPSAKSLAELRGRINESSTVLSFSERNAALALLDALESILDGRDI